jgi:hypothetical protein
MADDGVRLPQPTPVPIDAEPHARVLTATFALG